MRYIFVLLLLSSPALAKDFPVTDQDQQNIQGICDVAAAAPALNRDMRAQVSGWCVSWEKRVSDANKPADPPKEMPKK